MTPPDWLTQGNVVSAVIGIVIAVVAVKHPALGALLAALRDRANTPAKPADPAPPAGPKPPEPVALTPANWPPLPPPIEDLTDAELLELRSDVDRELTARRGRLEAVLGKIAPAQS